MEFSIWKHSFATPYTSCANPQFAQLLTACANFVTKNFGLLRVMLSRVVLNIIIFGSV